MLLRFMILVIVLAAVAGCQQPAKSASIEYAATVPPVAMILHEIVKGRAEVSTLMQSGASPHTFEPTPSLMATASRSKAVFWAGKGLDSWAEKTDCKDKVEMMSLIDPSLLLVNPETSPAAPKDPHFWLDPTVVKSLVPKLVEKLTELDPEGKGVYEANASVFAAKLDRLDASVASILRRSKGKAIVLIHPSMQYLASRYGIQIAAVVETSPGKEPTVAGLNALIKRVQAMNAAALFTEPQLPQKEAVQISRLSGLPLGTLDPLGGVEDRLTYESLILYNAKELMTKL